MKWCNLYYFRFSSKGLYIEVEGLKVNVGAQPPPLSCASPSF